MAIDLGRKPDILSCLANLSSDEVFTPPELANEMLDDLASTWASDHGGANIWEDSSLRFLDPCTKSGVFLREITKRLVDGLAAEIPNLQERVDHILTRQIYGIATTELTSLVARRSLYCSKLAKGKYSVTDKLNTKSGNIWFTRSKHTWEKTKCKYCGALRKHLERDDELENYAYAFIHTHDIKAWVAKQFGGNMNFDVVVGNPPYQMKGGSGGSSASSIYQLFVEQAKRLDAKYTSMVIPSRWLAGGRGLDEFRREMLNSNELSTLVDFPISKDVFPGVDVKGGVCYFLRSTVDRDKCKVRIKRGADVQQDDRILNEFDVFVRDPRSASILRKVLKENELPVTSIMTNDTPFGIATNFRNFRNTRKTEDIALHFVHKGQRGIGYLPRNKIRKNVNLIDKWKVLVPKSGSDGGQKLPDSVLGKPWISAPPSAATQTFLALYATKEREVQSIESYYRTKFFRHLVSLRKFTQDALHPMYSWVPIQKWNKIWSDDELYSKYKLTNEEADYIESVIRPMLPT